MNTESKRSDEQIRITINGKTETIKKGTILKNFLKQIEPVDPSEKEYLIVSSKKEKKFVEGYLLNTNLGRILVDFKEDLGLKNVKLAWKTTDVVVFGPISYEAHVGKSIVSKEVERNVNDIFLLYGASESYLGFSISNHKDSSLVPEDQNSDVIGKVTAGASLLKKFGKDDFIKDVEVKYETKSSIEKLRLNSKLIDGMEISSHVDIELEKSSPLSVESFLTFMDSCDNILTIEDATNAYIRTENPIPFSIPEENNKLPRKKGSVFVRNRGFRRNSIYFYRSDFMRQVHLNNIGKVTNGLDIIKVARNGEKILIRTNPKRVFVIGMTQSEAHDELNELGITQERSGDTSDDSIVVSQSPSITMGIDDKLTTIGIPKDDLIHIKFCENEAPLSTNYLKNVSEFYKNYPIGKLDIVAASESLIMLDTDYRREAIAHENVPERGEAGYLGITNMSRSWYGMIGIRLMPDEEYGPTGELLQSTNIVGKVVKGFEKLGELKSALYFTEES